eukprot:4738435-Ditylum_brightwellii.AAC.1
MPILLALASHAVGMVYVPLALHLTMQRTLLFTSFFSNDGSSICCSSHLSLSFSVALQHYIHRETAQALKYAGVTAILCQRHVTQCSFGAYAVG